MNYLMFVPVSYVAVKPAKEVEKAEKHSWISSLKLFFATVKN